MLTTAFQIWHHNEQVTALTVLVGIGVAVSIYIMVLIHRMVLLIREVNQRQQNWEIRSIKDVKNAEEGVVLQIKERKRVRARDDKQDEENHGGIV